MKEMIYKTLILDDRYKYILEGLLNTIVMAFFAVIIGIILGLIVSIIRNDYEVNKKHKILNFISKMYVEIIRGTPVILQLMIIYYVIFKSVNINIILAGNKSITIASTLSLFKSSTKVKYFFCLVIVLFL